MQDTFIVSESKRYFRRDREKEMQIFLFESNIVFTKKEELPTKKIRYLNKYCYLLSDIHIVEHIEGDPTKFGLRKGSTPQSDQTTILKATSEENRKLWVKTIRERILEFPMKGRNSDTESNGSSVSKYAESLESVKKLSVTEPNAIKQTSSNNGDSGMPVEMRKQKKSNGKSQQQPPPILHDNDTFLLPLDEQENHYENLVRV
jgi:hypothetical protein